MKLLRGLVLWGNCPVFHTAVSIVISQVKIQGREGHRLRLFMRMCVYDRA